MISVTKADGRRQIFQKEKVIWTCIKMGASRKVAQIVADKIESRIYDGIPTKKILQMIFTFMKEHRPEVGHQIDLREAISLLRPKPDFEKFVGLLLKEQGYRVEMNNIINGKCIEHEVDVIAKKGNENVLVEVKHHFQFHTFTGLGVFLEANSTFEDLVDGHNEGKNNVNFNQVLIVCNTKISDHAKRYSACRNMSHIGWKSPVEHGLERMIEEKQLYPITLLKNLDRRSQEQFGDAGIVLLRQLLEYNFNELFNLIRIPRKRLESFVEKAKMILHSK